MSRESFEQLLHLYQKQKAYHDCENAIGRLTYYMTEYHGEKIVSLWADRNDCTLEMPWGCYDGIVGVKRFFLQVMGDRKNAEVLERIRGVMCFTTLDTQVLKVAEDGRTARGSWFCPGCETYGKTAIYEEFQGVGFWTWSKMAADFIFENGEWKIWHLKVHQIFRTEYHTPWIKAPEYKGWVLGEPMTDRPASFVFRKYDSDAPQWDDIDVPQDYYTFADVAPGYSYKTEAKING